MDLIYHSSFEANLQQYGIQIPLLDMRSQQVFYYLKQRFDQVSPLASDVLATLSPLNKTDLLLAHDSSYVEALYGPGLRQEILSSYELVDAQGKPYRFKPDHRSRPLEHLFEHVLWQARGTLLAMESALKQGFCFFLGGGMHHAVSKGGRGFCLINDIVVGIRKLQADKQVQQAWVIDVDAHKGDGTAEMTYQDDSILSLSLHMKTAWPFGGQERLDDPILKRYPSGIIPWEIPSDVEIAIAAKEESKYLMLLEEGLEKLAGLSPKRPDLVIVVNGSDPFEKDVLPSSQSLKLNADQMLKRDQLIYHFLKRQNAPQCYVMAGGYGPEAWEPYAHFLTWYYSQKSY